MATTTAPPPAKKHAKKATAQTRRVGRQAVAAGAGRTGSLVGLLSLSLTLVLLYVALDGAGELAGFLGGLQRGLRWITDPHAVIRFKGDN